jgi:hypothetical protein
MTTAADFKALFAEIDTETTRIGVAFETRDAKIRELIERIQTGGGSMTADEETEIFGEGRNLVAALKLVGTSAVPSEPVPTPGEEPTPTPGEEPTPTPGTEVG